VVLFSVILGIALSGIERRERLLDVLQVVRGAISAATRFVTRLTPYGLFAIAANAAGTLSLEQLSRLQVYLVAYVAVGLMVSLWVLPGLVAALTPIRARDVLGESRDALITAFFAGDLHRAAGPHVASHALWSPQRRQSRAGGGHRAGLLQPPHTGKFSP
jgi:Na+/H+-dicarboxylate symporter